MNEERCKLILKSYRLRVQQKKEAEQDLELIWYELSGVKGVAFDKVPSTSSMEDWRKVARFEEKEEDIRRILKRKERAEEGITEARELLNALSGDMRGIVNRLYVNGESYTKVAQDEYMSVSGLYGRVMKAFKDIPE